jgi:hypothetical protein
METGILAHLRCAEKENPLAIPLLMFVPFVVCTCGSRASSIRPDNPHRLEITALPT